MSEEIELTLDGKRYRVTLGPHGAAVKLWKRTQLFCGWRWVWGKSPRRESIRAAAHARILAEDVEGDGG